MVKSNDIYLFSPQFPYNKIDWEDSACLLAAFEDRMMGFYLEPARKVASLDNISGLFASTLLCAAAVEAIARLTKTKKSGSKEVAAWLYKWVPCFTGPSRDGGKKSLADLFHEYFRNGLVHNARVKSLGQITTEIAHPVQVQDGKLSVNPTALVEAIIDGFKKQLSELSSKPSECKIFRQNLVNCFQEEKESLEISPSRLPTLSTQE